MRYRVIFETTESKEDILAAVTPLCYPLTFPTVLCLDPVPREEIEQATNILLEELGKANIALKFPIKEKHYSAYDMDEETCVVLEMDMLVDEDTAFEFFHHANTVFRERGVNKRIDPGFDWIQSKNVTE